MGTNNCGENLKAASPKTWMNRNKRDADTRQRAYQHQCGNKGSKVLAATVVGAGVDTITMFVSHETEFES
jgi:hypothetical protein